MSVWSLLSATARRLRPLLRRDRFAADLESEMRLHLELRAERLREQGLSASEARVAARRRFGNALDLQERSRDEWGYRWVERLWQDVRFGARMLRRDTGFAAIAIGAVGIAIGINAGFFTLVDAFVWQPVPVARPERLVKLFTVDGRGLRNIRFSYPDLAAIASGSRAITDVVAYVAQSVAVKSSHAVPARAGSLGLVTGNYFTALGGSATVGRVLSARDDEADASPVVVISDGYWTSAFSRAGDVVGRDLIVNGAHTTIVGVAAPSFIGINPLVPDAWMTLAQAERIGATPGRLLDPKNRFIPLHGRLREAFTLPQAAAELSPLIAEPSVPKGSPAEATRITGAVLMPNESLLPGNSDTVLALSPALFVVALVLVIACANLANLLLCRALVRQREIAVRLAMGASRGRLLRQLLTEALLIGVAGAILGFVLAAWTVKVVSRSYLSFVPPTYGTLAFSLHPSWRVVVYTVVLACVTTLTFGLAPALQATSPNLTGMLRGDAGAFGGKVRRSRMRDWLIAAQVAGSVVLITAAAVLTRSVQRFASSRSGLEPERVFVVNFGLAPAGHLPQILASERTTLDARIAHIPGVALTARAAQPPFSQWPLLHVRPDAASADSGAVQRALPSNRVTPGYFDVVGQRIVDGRGFTTADSAGNAPVVVVTQAAARTLWPGKRAVGRTLRLVRANGESSPLVQVVGVVADAHSGVPWDPDDDGYIYAPATASDFTTRDMPLLVCTRANAAAVARSIGDAAAEIDPNAPLDVSPLSALHDLQVVPFRYAASITASIAALGLALAIVGLYGVVAFAVQQRRREIAVHVAVGAGPSAVLRLVMRGELQLIAAGLVVGLILAMGESKLINSLTLPLPALGVIGLTSVAALLLVVGTIATLIPAAAALRIAPMQVLRQE